MTLIDHNPFAAGTGLRHRLLGALRHRRSQRRARRDLAALPDHLLRDMGLNRFGQPI